MGHQLSQMCEMGEKFFWCSWKNHEPWVTIFYIYKRKPNVWWVTNYHECVRWKKKIFCFSVMTMNMSDHLLYIYIRGNLMCDGSLTITDVWDERKKIFVSPWPWPWVTIYYIYKRKPNVWWVTNYHRCVRWKKIFFDSPWPILMCVVFH